MNRKKLFYMTALPLCAAALLCSPVRAQHGERGQHEQEEAEISQPKTYGQAVHVIQRQLDRIKDLIAARKLDRVHTEAAVIRDVAKIMARLALQKDSAVPRDAIREINLIAKDLAATFGAIDEAGDSGDRAGTQKVYGEMVALFETLEKYAPAHPSAYVCPMYHERAKVYSSPGKCAICGMKRELVMDEGYSVDVMPGTAGITPGTSVELEITLRNSRGRVVQNLDVVQEELLHLQVVSKDLSWYAHTHPERQSSGTFGLSFTFPSAREYVLFHAFTPKGAHRRQVVAVSLTVPGPAPSPTKLVVDADRSSKTVHGYRVTLNTREPIVVGRETTLGYTISQAGEPVTDLEPYLGAMGHLAIIGEDLSFVPNHPGGHAEHGEPMLPSTGPEVRFDAEFASAGLYKTWVQFKHRGKIITVAFVIQATETEGRHQGHDEDEEHEDEDRDDHDH